MNKTVKITLEVNAKIWEKFKLRAKRDGLSPQEVINILIDQYINNKIELAI